MGSRARRLRAAALVALAALGCTTGGDLPTGPGASELPELTAEALGQHAVRLQWGSVASSVRLERRVNLQGDFAEISGDLPHAQTSYIDDALEPSTFYGYRLAAYDAFGKRMGNSTVVGARTAPPPGIQVTVTTDIVTAPTVDPDGYELTVAGPSDTTRVSVDVAATLLLSPLAPGAYRLTLGGLAPQCIAADSLTRTAIVTAEGTETQQQLAIAVQCRNPERGRASAVVTTNGDLPDPDGFEVQLAGLAGDTGLPDSLRAYVLARSVGTNGGTVNFDDLRPGSYAFTVSGLAPNCTLEGPQQVSFPVGLLEDIQKTFSVSCPDPASAGRPFALRTTWAPGVASAGSKVALDLSLDLSARAGQDMVAFETEIRTAVGVLRYDSTRAADLPTVVANQPQPGLALVSGFATGAGPTGVVKLARVWYTVVGANGATATTQTVHRNIVGNTVGRDPSLPPELINLDGDIRVVEGTLTVGTGGGANQAPLADANGPYTGTTGTPVTFSATGSSDPDGSIATYAWTFGDGASGTGASPAHAYASPGTYAATLTVTDNLGLTGSATAQVSIAPAGGGGSGCGSGTSAQPFVLCSTWSPATGAAGDKVLLTQTVDLTADGAQDLVAFESTVVTDAALVRFDSARAGGITSLVVNGATPGTVRMAGFVTGSGPKGVVTVAKIYYTVLAATGQATTQTTFANFVGTSGDLLDGKIAKVEGTLTIGAGSAGGGGTSTGSELDWQGSFGPVDAVTHLVSLNLTLDLRSDPAVTLSGWQVGTLTWDPAVLSYASTDVVGGAGAVNPTNALQGKLSMSGTPPSGGRTGLVTVAVVRFVAFAAPGSATSTSVTLGSVAGLVSGGAADLLPRVVVHDGSFVTP
jgi:PKD repeat protein